MKHKKGFTLIELLVVIAIIGLLSSVILGSLQTARARAKDAVRRSDFVQLQRALEMYYSDNGSYPSTKVGSIPNWRDSNRFPDDWIPGLVPKYISKLPQEPDKATTLCLADSPPAGDPPFGTSYRYKSDGVSYKIHDHCPPISPAMINTSDPWYHCSGATPVGAAHPNSWSICGGPIPCSTLWCTSTYNGNYIINADNEGNYDP